MSCSTVSSACVHGRAHVRALFVQATAAERRRPATIKKQAERIGSSSSGSDAKSISSQVVAAASLHAAVTYPNTSHGSRSKFGSLQDIYQLVLHTVDSLMQRTSPEGFARLSLLQRALDTSLCMMLYRAFTTGAMADTQQTMDPR